MTHGAPTDRVSTGIDSLDEMLGGEGLFRGSSSLVSGTAGTGKTSIAAHFVDAVCRRGERAVYYAYEESEAQIIRNMRSIGLDLEPWVRNNLLRFHAVRPTYYGLEMHLVQMHKLVREFDPSVVVVDPITNLTSIGTAYEANSMVRRLVDFLKTKSITAVFTDLAATPDQMMETEIGVSSLMDTWLLLQHVERNGERRRGITVLKSRGTAHSAQVREFCITDKGVVLHRGLPGGSSKGTE